MGREPFLITNPSGNNRDLIVECIGQQGQLIRLAFLKPGQTFRSEKENLTVKAVPRPVTLDFIFKDGVFSQKEIIS